MGSTERDRPNGDVARGEFATSAGLALGLALAVAAMRLGAAEPGVIPAERLVAWDPGVRNGIPAFKVQVRLEPEALGGANAGPAVQAAIDQVSGHGTVLLPEGVFVVRDSLRLKKGVVLRGLGADRTRLVFDLASTPTQPAIAMRGAAGATEIPMGADTAAGLDRLRLAGLEGVVKDQTVQVYGENDPALLYTQPDWNVGWAGQSMGQLTGIADVRGDWVRFDVPLRLAYRAELNPRLRTLDPIAGAGLEALRLERKDAGDASMVAIDCAVNCWIRDCIMEYASRAHIWVEQSRFITIQGNTLHHAHEYGGGGHGYGVVLGKHATDCLVTDNVLYHLRHALMLKQGANGNVMSYNYSFDRVSHADLGRLNALLDQQGLSLADVALHGHYSYMNLFEGNVVQCIRYADYWGPVGPLTTCYRNRVAADIIVGDHSHRANVVANTLARGAVHVRGGSRDAFVEGNRVGGQMVWNTARAESVFPASLYLKAKPAFWGDAPWPALGADVDTTTNAVPIPAQARHERMSGSAGQGDNTGGGQ